MTTSPEGWRLVSGSVGGRERVLLTGASGWFGRSALSLLGAAHGLAWIGEQVLAAASSSRTIDVLGLGPVQVVAATAADVARFRPTLVLNCAFPTRDKVDGMGWEAYVASASSMTAQLLAALALPSTERAVTFSSGAAVPSAKFPADLHANPYGVLKAEEEREFLRIAGDSGKGGVVCRVWAASGPHVQWPRNYALSGMILDGLVTGRVTVRSAAPVIREYASVEQAVALALRNTLDGTGAFDTRGVSVEVGDLAERVGAQLSTPVDRPAFDPAAPADVYASADPAWFGLCDRYGMQALSLDRQIALTIEGVRPFAGTPTSR